MGLWRKSGRSSVRGRGYREKLVDTHLKYEEKLVDNIEKNWSIGFCDSKTGTFSPLNMEKNWSIA